MTMATTDRPGLLADMGRKEAEEVTQAIKENCDSLGAMLLQARDRKAYKALGYRTFDSYCKTEFGRSVSGAYFLIEDAKILAQLEAKISENYEEKVSLNFPASHLRPLKDVADIDDKLRAIEYAQKLAASEGKKATKKHLEIAVFEISGKRSEDFRSAIQSLGFTKGIPVEITKNLKKDRGFVTKVDKLGKIHVELYYSGRSSIPFDATDLRILGDAEKPANPASDYTLKKGDKVKIFAKGLEGKNGEIFIWKTGKLASVVVGDETLPIDIAYAEMELIKPEQKNTNWDSELIWTSGKNTYYFFPEQTTIYSDKWPHDLSIQTPPNPKENNPAEFIQNWEEKGVTSLIESFMTPARVKTLALAQAIELPEDEGNQFVADLITSLSQLFPKVCKPPENTDALITENQQLRDQLSEAEAAIQSMVNAASTASALEPPETTDFLLENTAKTSSPGESVAQPKLPPELASQINSVRNKFLDLIENYEKSKKFAAKKKEIESLNENIETLQKRLENLKKFEQLKIGNTICHQRRIMVLGKITGLEFSQGEMPIVWVKYFQDGELENTATSELVRMIFTVDL